MARRVLGRSDSDIEAEASDVLVDDDTVETDHRPPPAPDPTSPSRSPGPGRMPPRGPASPPSTGRPARPGKARADRRGPRKVQGRRSRQVVRRIDSWTVLKLSFLFYLCVALVVLIAGVALWNIAGAFDVISNVEKFIRQLFDLQTFKLQAKVIFEYSCLAAGILVLLGTFANVLMALLYNLISDVIGGVQIIVLEEQDS